MIQGPFVRPSYGCFAAGAAILLVLLAGAARAAGPATPGGSQAIEGTPDAALYRIFLIDGGMLVSYGEYARLGDRVVLSIPIGGTDSSPVLHLVTIAEGDVDWTRTTAYAEAVRARRYADTRGDADFARLTREVADTLNQVGLVSDSAERLALAETARRRLVEWPSRHFGYRAEEIAQMAAWLDEVVSELRIAAGLSSFDLALVARADPAMPAVALLPPPDYRERIEFGLAAARRTTDAAERVLLLRAVIDLLQPSAPEGSWMAAVRARASADLAVELRIDRAYTDLTRRVLARAAAHERAANVRGLESLVRAVLDEDARLQRARPAGVAALLAALDARIDAARRLRLARDAWELRVAAVRDYWRAIRQPLDRLLGLREWLVDVRQLAGPAPRSVRRLAEHAARSAEELARIEPPALVSKVHATLSAAAALASRAAAARLDAVQTGTLDPAWRASSAAAGSLLVLDQALEDLRGLTREPGPHPR